MSCLWWTILPYHNIHLIDTVRTLNCVLHVLLRMCGTDRNLMAGYIYVCPDSIIYFVFSTILVIIFSFFHYFALFRSHLCSWFSFPHMIQHNLKFKMIDPIMWRENEIHRNWTTIHSNEMTSNKMSLIVSYFILDVYIWICIYINVYECVCVREKK